MMKEHPESNYVLSVSSIEESIGLPLSLLLPRSYLIEINRVTSAVIVPWLPALPWPPRYPTDWDRWRDRDEAAVYLFATHTVTERSRRSGGIPVCHAHGYRRPHR
jgi:hypothetical protein